MKFIPEACTGEEALFEGHFEVKAPNFEQRYQYMDDSGFDLTQKEGQELDKEQTRAQMRSLRKLVGYSKDHVESVSIKRKKDNKEFKSFDELSNDPSCDALLIDLGTKMVTGFELGNG